jgi:hypothetical protein
MYICLLRNSKQAKKEKTESINARVFIYLLALPTLLLYSKHMRFYWSPFTDIILHSFSTYGLCL